MTAAQANNEVDLSPLKGRFVAFEGADGSGKSTQLARFAERCAAQGLRTLVVREPGGTPIGERVRDILLDPACAEMTVACETLLYMASRAQLVEEAIRPALARGELVIADRFVTSTIVYQGAAGGLALDAVGEAARIACGDTFPELVVIFDVDAATARTRMGAEPDRMESKGDVFDARVREGYRAIALADPSRHVLIDATGDEGAVFSRLLGALTERLKLGAL